MITDDEDALLGNANNQWEKLVDLYNDITTKKNDQRYIIFTKPFFERDEMGCIVRDGDGHIKIIAKCLGCGKMFSALNNNLHNGHTSCPKSKNNYETFKSIEKQKAETKENMKKEIAMFRKKLNKEKVEKDKMEETLKALTHENDNLWGDDDWLKDQMLRSKKMYSLYDFPNKLPGLVIVYRMMFEGKRNMGLMKLSKKYAKELNQVFKSFGFAVKVVKVESSENLSKQVDALLNTKASKLKDYQSIFVFVFSHGCYDRICDSQNRIFEIQRLRKSLTDCIYLSNKPKVLVIDACQILQAKSFEIDPNVLTPTSNCLDLLEIRSSSPGQISFGISVNDEDLMLDFESIFMRNLIDTLKCNYRLGLSRMMFLVQKKVNESNIEAEKSTGGSFKQTPELRSTLREDIFLKRS